MEEEPGQESEVGRIFRTFMEKDPRVLSMTFATKNGVLVRTTLPEAVGRTHASLIALLGDRARGAIKEFDMADEAKFMTLRTTDMEVMVYFDEDFYLIVCHEPGVDDEGEPIIEE